MDSNLQAIRQEVNVIQLQAIRKTLQEFAQALPGGYLGSRKAKARYMYKGIIRANFIELAEEHGCMEPEAFYDLLVKVKGVREVKLRAKSKAEQNNPGAQNPQARTRRRGHYQARTFLVFSHLYPEGKGMEFELTENDHMKDSTTITYPLTISARYGGQPDDAHALEAWRILRLAVAGKELDQGIVCRFETEMKQLLGVP